MQSHNLPNIFHVFNGHQSLTQKAAGNAARVVLVDVLPDIDDSREITSSYIKHRQNNEFDIRWFNHGNAIQRCGHGTLAAAAYINNVGYDLLKAEQASMRLPVENPQTLIFHSDKETLFVRKEMSKNTYSLHLPIESIKQATHHSLPFHCQRLFCTQAVNGYLIAELDSVQHIESFAMTPSIIEAIKKRTLIVTAKNQTGDSDIYFRYFAPQYGQQEDDATGSAASLLWPFWSSIREELLRCYQASKKGGYMVIHADTHGIRVSGNVELELNHYYSTTK